MSIAKMCYIHIRFSSGRMCGPEAWPWHVGSVLDDRFRCGLAPLFPNMIVCFLICLLCILLAGVLSLVCSVNLVLLGSKNVK